MRHLAALTLLAPFALSAQIVAYYVIPPTAGCNGVWAVSSPSMNCGPAPFVYTAQPEGCLQTLGWSFAAPDTVFIPLCSLPCSLLIQSADGDTCGGDVDPSMGVEENSASHTLSFRTSSDGIEVISTRPLSAGTFHLLDLGGRTVHTQRAEAGQYWHMAAPDAAGAYVLTFDGDDVHLRERMVWVR